MSSPVEDAVAPSGSDTRDLENHFHSLVHGSHLLHYILLELRKWIIMSRQPIQTEA
jgi:hypothetical protein